MQIIRALHPDAATLLTQGWEENPNHAGGFYNRTNNVILAVYPTAISWRIQAFTFSGQMLFDSDL